MNRVEYLEFAKSRAKKYVELGQFYTAFTSLANDLENHEELKRHPSIDTGLVLILNGQLNDADSMNRFIDGFN